MAILILLAVLCIPIAEIAVFIKVGQAIGLAPTDRWWLAMPFFHVGGLAALIRCARFGAAAVLTGRFEAERALAGWEADGV